jgi:hypothetical protein
MLPDHADARCALCSDILTSQNRSKEHVLPNAIGGRLTTSTFICNRCNNTCGSAWDAELASQTNWFSSSLGIVRQRGDVPREKIETVDGTRLWLHHDGTMTPEHPSAETNEVDGSATIRISARSVEEAMRMLKDAKRRHPRLDVDKAIAEMEVSEAFLTSPIHVKLELGGPEAGRSIVKTAFAYASTCGVPHSCCDAALRYLKDRAEDPPFGFAYTFEFVKQRPSDRIFHCVGLMGDPATGRLLTYVEYFSHFRVLVGLGNDYRGIPVHACHAIDPVTGQPVDVELDWDVPDEKIRAILAGTADNLEGMAAAARQVMPIILRRNEERQRNRTIREAFEHAAISLGIQPGEAITAEHSPQFVSLMMEKLSPYLHHLVERGYRPPPLPDPMPADEGGSRGEG